MKTTLTLEATDPSDINTLRLHLDAPKWHSALWELDQWLRSEVKHGEEPGRLQEARDKLHELMREEGIEFD